MPVSAAVERSSVFQTLHSCVLAVLESSAGTLPGLCCLHVCFLKSWLTPPAVLSHPFLSILSSVQALFPFRSRHYGLSPEKVL